MKFKKTIFYILIILSVIFIFYITKSDKIRLVIIGDSLSNSKNSFDEKIYGYSEYIYNYFYDKNMIDSYINLSNDRYSIQNIIDDIDNNKLFLFNNKKYNLKSSLRESDLLVVSVGMLDLSSQIKIDLSKGLSDFSTDNIINLLNNFVLSLKKYAKGNIMMIGYYNPFPQYKEEKKDIDKYIKKLNSFLNELCEKNDIYFVDIFDIFNDGNYIVNPISTNPNNLGYQKIFTQVLKVFNYMY